MVFFFYVEKLSLFLVEKEDRKRDGGKARVFEMQTNKRHRD